MFQPLYLVVSTAEIDYRQTEQLFVYLVSILHMPSTLLPTLLYLSTPTTVLPLLYHTSHAHRSWQNLAVYSEQS